MLPQHEFRGFFLDVLAEEAHKMHKVCVARQNHTTSLGQLV
jgi:hypothetical protein